MSQTHRAILALALAALLSGCDGERLADAERGERGSALYRRAIAAEQSGDIKEAIRLFNKVLIEEPRSFSAHFQLATLLQDREEDYLGAIYHYKQYLFLRPESEKGSLANDRIRVAEQMLAPQILRKVGDSVQGISQGHLLKENDRLNRALTDLQGEKATLSDENAQSLREIERLKIDNERLRGLLRKMRVEESTVTGAGALTAREAAASARTAPAGTPVREATPKSLKALREEADALASQGGARPPPRKPLVDMPSSDQIMKKVEGKLAEGGVAKPVDTPPPGAKPAGAEPAVSESAGKRGGTELSMLSLFGRGGKKEKKKLPEKLRTYVVQPGDTLFRVSEKFYGDATKWRRIREANKTNIDPDGRIRAGQIIVIP